MRVIDQAFQVALEVPDIDGIEAGKRREQAPVGLGDPIAREVALAGESLLELVEGLEQRGQTASS